MAQFDEPSFQALVSTMYNSQNQINKWQVKSKSHKKNSLTEIPDYTIMSKLHYPGSNMLKALNIQRMFLYCLNCQIIQLG